MLSFNFDLLKLRVLDVAVDVGFLKFVFMFGFEFDCDFGALLMTVFVHSVLLSRPLLSYLVLPCREGGRFRRLRTGGPSRTAPGRG